DIELSDLEEGEDDELEIASDEISDDLGLDGDDSLDSESSEIEIASDDDFDADSVEGEDEGEVLTTADLEDFKDEIESSIDAKIADLLAQLDSEEGEEEISLDGEESEEGEE